VRAAGLTGSRAGGRLAVVGPGWSGTGAWTSYALWDRCLDFLRAGSQGVATRDSRRCARGT
jgi:hypothetical protein